MRCKAYKVRLYPTKKQIGTLEWTLRRCKEVYNAALQERRDAYDAFFRRVKNGETPGYPRFKNGDRYHSFTYPQGGYEIIGNRLHLSKIGYVKIKLHRKMTGKVKTCTIKREGEQWYAVFSTEYELDPTSVFHPGEEAVGIDLGIKSFAVLSTGEIIESPRFYRQGQAQIQEGHRTIHRRQIRSHRRGRAKKELSRLYRKVRNRRHDFLHNASRKLVKQYGTSQACCGCECIVEKDLSVRWHCCPHCGTELDRDHNAAKNILHRYQEQRMKGAGSVPHKPVRLRSVRGTV
jgi:putative transposase